MEIVLVIIATLFGVISADSIGFHISRFLAWRKTELSGKWSSEFEKNGEIIVDHVLLYGSFSGVTWGVVQVSPYKKTHPKPYRIKVVREYKSVYSIVFKPQDRSVADIGTGTIVFDHESGIAKGVVVGFDQGAVEPVIRNIAAQRLSV